MYFFGLSYWKVKVGVFMLKHLLKRCSESDISFCFSQSSGSEFFGVGFVHGGDRD
uniref:Uncharacterized protein n=1 Tax=Rhizophora mucronata TaxID=61149 RepID=A0A2P2Q6K6_RHIMU